MRDRLRSVRFRITAVSTVVVAVVLAVASVILVEAQRRRLVATADTTVVTLSDAAIAAGARVPDALDDRGKRTFVQIVRGDEVVAHSRNMDGVAALESTGFQTLRIPELDDDAYRVLSRRVPGGAVDLTVHVGLNLARVHDSIEALTSGLALGVPGLVVGLGVVIWVIVGRTLRPVETICAEVAEITASGLHRRVSTPPTRDEIARLAETMNAMLARLEASAAAQRRFVADASHELRTPLARIQAVLDADAGDDASGSRAAVADEVAGLSRLAGDLLYVARADAGAAPLEIELLDLDDVVGREAQAAPVDADMRGVSAVQVRGDRLQLARAVRNLLDNAARHASGDVVITLSGAEGTARLTVADDGPGIAPEDCERVFERFVRLDDSRGRRAGGTGLGLPIAREIVRRHGGDITVHAAEGGGACFVVTLPAAI